MADPSKEQLLETKPESFNTDTLSFAGLRGDVSNHLMRDQLEAGLKSLPPAPKDEGWVELLVARGPNGERQLPDEALLTEAGGMPGDRWATDDRYGPDFQLATTRADLARLIANGQPLELHGDNLYLDLDLSADNLPVASKVRLGEALLCVTPRAHNGCKKWVQRFGLSAMQLNLAPAFRHLRVRGIYFRVVSDGVVRVGDRVEVVERAAVRE